MDNFLEFRDEINERVTKIKSIVTCLLATNDADLEIPRDEIYSVIWTIEDMINGLQDYVKSLDCG